MMPFLEQGGVDIACIGNHDLDFGVPKLADLISRLPFPWLSSNLKLKSEKDSMLAGCKVYHII